VTRHAGLTGVIAALALAAPAGAAIRPTPQLVARGIPNATNVAFDPAGGMWVTSGGNYRSPTDGVWHLPAGASKARQVVKGLDTALGLAWYGGELYVSSRYRTRAPGGYSGRVDAYTQLSGTRFAKRRTVLDDLPAGLHNPDSIAPGPDGRLYLGVGTKTNDGRNATKREGTVLSFPPSGSEQRIEARGLRNPYGLAFLPGTTRLYVSDNGRDDLGETQPPDELNVFDAENPAPHFGFPRKTGTPEVRIPAHAAAGGVAATRDWDGRAAVFVTTNGSTIRTPEVGSDVRLHRPGTRGAKVYARGFREHDPLGAAIGPDGALYVTLWESGRVVRFRPPQRAQ
jgi:glucose/arabinose dehydrogenase